jgi:ketosteroid isomerase-like protein
MSEVEAVRSVIDARIRAIGAKDAQAAVAMLDPEIVAFEVAGPPQVPAEQARDVAATQAWLDSFDGAPGVELQDLTIHADGDVAFCHSLNRLTRRMADGRTIDLVMRSTLGLRKRGGEWTIVHAHTSVPR